MIPNDDCLVLLKKGIEPALYCIHSVSGSGTLYRHMKSPILNSMYGLNAVGAHLDAQPKTSINDMAHHYLQQIKQVQSHGPYNLCGFSMGGLIAYEMACQLRSHGEGVSLLGLIDVQVTIERNHSAEEILNGFDAWITFINILFGNVDPYFQNLDNPFWKYSREEKLDYLLKLRLKTLDSRHPRNVNAEWIDKYYSFFYLMNKANIDYKMGEYNSDLTYFATRNGSHIQSVKNLKRHVTGKIEVIDIEGSHLNLFSKGEHAIALGRQLANKLDC